jgi:hypothetical protein
MLMLIGWLLIMVYLLICIIAVAATLNRGS